MYLANSSTFNFLGTTMFKTKHILMAFTRSYRSIPSIALNISSIADNLLKSSSSITFAFWVSTTRFINGVGRESGNGVVTWAFSVVLMASKHLWNEGEGSCLHRSRLSGNCRLSLNSFSRSRSQDLFK